MTDLELPPPSSEETPAPVPSEATDLAGGGVASPSPAAPEPVTVQDIVDVVQAAVRKAKDGDMYGAEVVRRFWRGRRETIVLDLGEVRTAEQIAEVQGKVVALAFTGTLTLREGRDASTMIENRRKALHTLEQQRQLDDMMEFSKQHAPGKKGPP